MQYKKITIIIAESKDNWAHNESVSGRQSGKQYISLCEMLYSKIFIKMHVRCFSY